MSTPATQVTWQRGTPPRAGWYLVTARLLGGDVVTMDARWDGRGGWTAKAVLAWAPLPAPAPEDAS